MDDTSGELIRLAQDQAPPLGFSLTPEELDEAANAALGNKDSVIIDPAGIGLMSQCLRDRRRAAAKRKVKNRRLRKGKNGH